MPASLADFARAEKTVRVPFEGTDLAVVVTYRRWSWKALPPLPPDPETGEPQPAAGENYVQWFERHIISWDITGEDGKPLPFTEAGLNLLDRGILDVVITAVNVDRLPNVLTATP